MRTVAPPPPSPTPIRCVKGVDLTDELCDQVDVGPSHFWNSLASSLHSQSHKMRLAYCASTSAADVGRYCRCYRVRSAYTASCCGWPTDLPSLLMLLCLPPPICASAYSQWSCPRCHVWCCSASCSVLLFCPTVLSCVMRPSLVRACTCAYTVPTLLRRGNTWF